MQQLQHRRWILKVNLLVVMAHDAITDLVDRPALLLHLISIKSFRHAGSAVRAMSSLKATVQALVAGVTVAVAEAG